MSIEEDCERMDIRQLAKEIYEKSGITLNELHNTSLDLVGSELSLSLLKRWSAQDGWKKAETGGDMEILAKLMDLIDGKVNDSTLSVQELARLTEAYDRLIRIKEKLNMLQRVSGESVQLHGRTSQLHKE